MNEREKLIDGLRQCAAYLELHEDVPTPYTYHIYVPTEIDHSGYDYRRPQFRDGQPVWRPLSMWDTKPADHWAPDESGACSIPMMHATGVFMPKPEFQKRDAQGTAIIDPSTLQPVLDEDALAVARLAEFSRVARALAHGLIAMDEDGHPNFEKSSSDTSIQATRRFGPIKLVASMSHSEAICTKVETGTRKVYKRDPQAVEAALKAIPEWETEETTYEWKCPPALLAIAVNE